MPEQSVEPSTEEKSKSKSKMPMVIAGIIVALALVAFFYPKTFDEIHPDDQMCIGFTRQGYQPTAEEREACSGVIEDEAGTVLGSPNPELCAKPGPDICIGILISSL